MTDLTKRPISGTNWKGQSEKDEKSGSPRLEESTNQKVEKKLKFQNVVNKIVSKQSNNKYFKNSKVYNKKIKIDELTKNGIAVTVRDVAKRTKFGITRARRVDNKYFQKLQIV